MLKFNRSQCVKLLTLLAVGIFAAVVAGCASQPPKQIDNGLKVRVKVGENLNPNGLGRPSPVFVRIYQLTDKTAFLDATYGDLSANDKAILGSSLLSRRDVEVCPVEAGTGESTAPASGCTGKTVVEFPIDLITKAEYIAVMAEFYHLHDPQGNWRTVTTFSKGDAPVLLIQLQGSSVSAGFE